MVVQTDLVIAAIIIVAMVGAHTVPPHLLVSRADIPHFFVLQNLAVLVVTQRGGVRLEDLRGRHRPCRRRSVRERARLQLLRGRRFGRHPRRVRLPVLVLRRRGGGRRRLGARRLRPPLRCLRRLQRHLGPPVFAPQRRQRRLRSSSPAEAQRRHDHCGPHPAHAAAHRAYPIRRRRGVVAIAAAVVGVAAVVAAVGLPVTLVPVQLVGIATLVGGSRRGVGAELGVAAEDGQRGKLLHWWQGPRRVVLFPHVVRVCVAELAWAALVVKTIFTFVSQWPHTDARSVGTMMK